MHVTLTHITKHTAKTRNARIKYFLEQKQCKYEKGERVKKGKDLAYINTLNYKYLIQVINTLNSVHNFINHMKLAMGSVR